jgi:hypothetical protein
MFWLQRVHCGCVASAYGIVLLDKGGVECIRCAQAHDSAASGSVVSEVWNWLCVSLVFFVFGTA